VKGINLQFDHHQFGNIKGSSTFYCLAGCYYTTSKADKRENGTSVTIDLRMAFDLIDHTTLIKEMIFLDFRDGWEK